ncbi:hypothetical protein PILCRDRAFT_748894 [Piloderma croceum F 1598]|uniref:Uncharacterized protein n=1 Tax=Piloderma croceum (strain F 1598) TaxID=765440 RepID=A0A0C3EUT8_PILCF|nr:hypothetical protein PILCRDRAFT_748894 [Piloderma croceum F 1598]
MVRVSSLDEKDGVRFSGYIPGRVSMAFKRRPWCMEKPIQSRGARVEPKLLELNFVRFAATSSNDHRTSHRKFDWQKRGQDNTPSSINTQRDSDCKIDET